MKHIIPFLFGLVLTACGGGGGSGSQSVTTVSDHTFIKTIKSDYAVYLSIVQGQFKNDSNAYVLVSGNQLNMGGTIPVLIFKLNAEGGGTDVTEEILGSKSVYASSNEALVADFNKDGIDDIFLPGFVDIENQLTATHVYISQPGLPHRHQVLESTWSHGAAVADINNDGNLDVIDSDGKIWVNDGSGNFTFKDHDWSTSLFWMHGMGVCAGNLLNNGRTQVVITDLNIANGSWPFNDTAVFELDNNLKPVTQHLLPMPYYDISNKSSSEYSHDVRCRVADVNNDGLNDLIIFSRPWASARNGNWTSEGKIQILVNNGNFNFTDQTNLLGFDANMVIDYSPIVKDFNGDGIPDIWSAPQLMISGNGVWTRRSYNQIPSNAAALIPVKISNKWGFAYVIVSDFNKHEVYFTKPSLTIDL